MSRSTKLNITKDQDDKDEVIIDITPTMTHLSPHAASIKRLRYCSFLMKVIGLLLIVGVVLLIVLLPNYIRNKNADSIQESDTDPTNAIFPEGS